MGAGDTFLRIQNLFVCGGKDNKLGLSWAKLSHIWYKLIRSLDLMSFFTNLDST